MEANTPNQAGRSIAVTHSGEKTGFAELASDALRYWEPRRLLYNLALCIVVFVDFYASWPASKAFVTQNSVYGVFFLAVLANVAYCAAYLVDLFVQFSGQREAWTRWRWSILAVGIVFAAVIAHFFISGILGSGSPN